MYLMDINEKFVNFYNLIIQLKEAESKLKRFNPEPKSELWEELDEEIYGLKSCCVAFQILDEEGYALTYHESFGKSNPFIFLHKKDIEFAKSPKAVIDLRWDYDKDIFYLVQKGDPLGEHEEYVPFTEEEAKDLISRGLHSIKYIKDSTKVWNRKKRDEYNLDHWF